MGKTREGSKERGKGRNGWGDKEDDGMKRKEWYGRRTLICRYIVHTYGQRHVNLVTFLTLAFELSNSKTIDEFYVTEANFVVSFSSSMSTVLELGPGTIGRLTRTRRRVIYIERRSPRQSVHTS